MLDSNLAGLPCPTKRLNALMEHRVAMLSSVLNSNRPIQMKILITSGRMCKLLATHKDLAGRVEKLETSYRYDAIAISLVAEDVQALSAGGNLVSASAPKAGNPIDDSRNELVFLCPPTTYDRSRDRIPVPSCNTRIERVASGGWLRGCKMSPFFRKICTRKHKLASFRKTPPGDREHSPLLAVSAQLCTKMHKPHDLT